MSKTWLLKALRWTACVLLTITTFSCCTQKKAPAHTSEGGMPVVVPTFDADTAFAAVAVQCAFGPRVPGTDAHRLCGDFLEECLRNCGATVISQSMDLKAYDGTPLPSHNIIGQFAPEKRKRVLLCSHWDSRPWADNDPDPSKHRTPIEGANDGASGVGVLLEVARQLSLQPTAIGIDIIFFDAEDAGMHQDDNGPYVENSWCLGSQYWARHPHTDDYMARYGILLDMVGGKDARFCQERLSRHYAKSIVDKVWDAAHAIGFGNFFPYAMGSYVTDDHLPVNEKAHIPCIDIIPYDEHDGFAPTWHTVSDDIHHIDPTTLRAVGQTILQVIYNEK